MSTRRSIGIVGYGDFGQFLEVLARKFAPLLEIRISSRRHEPDGTRFFSFEEVCASDIVIIAVSIRAFEETLLKVLPLLAPESILVEVNTVKRHPVELLRVHAAGKHYIATHPMFGPYSFEKQGGILDGMRVVVAEHTLAPFDYAQALEWLRTLKLEVEEMDADAHDRLLAETLFLTHYLAQTVVAGSFVRTDIDTKSFGYLMDAVESVQHDTELFRDVYRFNPCCKEIIERLERAKGEVDTLLEQK